MSDVIPAEITEPVVLYDLPEQDYHDHRGSLSASGAKLLAPPTACPAKYRWRLDHPEVKSEFDFGHVAHRLVLGKGSEIEVLPYDSMRSAAAKTADEEARAAGKVPILAHHYARALALVGAVKADPVGGPLFDSEGHSEVSLFWPDAEFGIVRRARLDRIKTPASGQRLIIGDLKTSRTAEPNAFGRAAADYGYAISAANYVDGVIACGLDPDPAFLLVVVEKEEPYVVSPFQVPDDLIALGRALMRRAMRTYVQCTAADQWPGYVSDVAELELPGYFHQRVEEALLS